MTFKFGDKVMFHKRKGVIVYHHKHTEEVIFHILDKETKQKRKNATKEVKG